MIDMPAELRSGKGHRDENFPVASWLIHPRHRGLILAFYDFVRAADDIADHADAGAGREARPARRAWRRPARRATARIAAARAAARGAGRARPFAEARAGSARRVPAGRDQAALPRLGRSDRLLPLSAMPVGRFVLDVHGESRATWPANDALCAALQIINHLQDCGTDYRNLDRVYIPLDALAASGRRRRGAGRTARVAGAARLPAPACRTHRAAAVARATSFPPRSTIGGSRSKSPSSTRSPHRLTRLLMARDPLSDRVHLRPARRRRRSAIARRSPRRVAARRPASARVRRRSREVRDRERARAHDRRAERASGSSFYTAMRILPRAQREAMFEIYSFCRAVDDIADDPGPRDPRRAHCSSGAAISTRSIAAPRRRALAGLAQAVREFDLKREDFIAVIDGMEMDVVADIRAPDRATLDLYCDRVASAVGRLSVRVFGMDARRGRCARPSSRPRAAAHQHSARPRRRRRARAPLSAARGAAGGRHRRYRPGRVLAHPAIAASLRAVVAMRAGAFSRSRGDHGAEPAPRGARAAHHGRRPIASFSTA